MFLSKSFGYALRGILYVASMQDEDRKVQLDEIAEKLSVPRHFLGKIMQQVVKAGFLKSTKGPYGGFSLSKETLQTPLIKLIEVTDDMEQFKVCILKLKHCDNANPCPLHYDMQKIKNDLFNKFQQTTINELLNSDKGLFIQSLSV